MALIEVAAKKEVGGVEKVGTINYEFGNNLADAAKRFGEEVVFSNFRQSAKITLQSIIRRKLEKCQD